MKRISPPALMMLTLAAILILRMNWPLMFILPFPANMIGIIPVGVGYVMMMLAWDQFNILGTPISNFDQPSRLVVVGLYRISRNPMYLGFVLMLAGICLLLGALSPFIGVLLFFVITDRLFITLEERVLASKFGHFYYNYKRKTRRWL